MPLQPIEIPETIKGIEHTSHAAHVIDVANERIETFMLAERSVSENFVPCDFHLLDQALTWIEQHHLLTGNRFCEFGAGFGVATLLTSLRGMESIGIEIESNLVDQASGLADDLDLSAQFYCGSFVPRGTSATTDLGREVENVDTIEGDIYEEIGLGLDAFDLFFAFPWPGEHHFFEAVFESGAAVNSLLLSYRGRDGMHLIRKE